MSTFLFHDLVYGPIKSRRLGNSLGINLLPTEKKYCNFNCIYCECGANIPGHVGLLPRCAEIAAALEKKLIHLKEKNEKVDSITFAGNGEPTIHPDFHEVISDTVNLRNKFLPDAKISVLSNATKIVNENTVATLKMIDNCILKIDSGIEETAKAIDRPVGNYSLKHQVELLKQFDGNFVLQTMFLSGEVSGKKIDNTTTEEVSAWLKIVEELRPKKVMIYTIARDTPEKNLQKASKETLDNIQKKVQNLGIEISVSY